MVFVCDFVYWFWFVFEVDDVGDFFICFNIFFDDGMCEVIFFLFGDLCVGSRFFMFFDFGGYLE